MPWLIVIGKSEALEWIIEHSRMAFRDAVRTDEIQPGDWFALYTSRGAYGNPTKDESQLIGRGRVTSRIRRGAVEFAGETFAKSCSVALDEILPLRNGIAFKPLIPQLKFVGGSERRWPGA